MKIANQKLGYFLIVCIIFVIFSEQCDAGKDKDKHKHKQSHSSATTKHHQHNNGTASQHQNGTAYHHQNHTAPNVTHDVGGVSDNNPPPIGWSLHNNPSQLPPSSNPHGYAAQHHIPGHPEQPHQSLHPQHSQANPVAQTPDSGSALGAGIGGLALGALGGAAGGYFLSNALNSGGKSGEETTVDETTLTSLSPNITEVTTEGIATFSIDVTTVTSELSAETTTSQIVTIENVTTTSEQPSLEVIKAEQKLAEPKASSSETPQDKSSGEISKLSLNIFMLSVVLSSIVLMRT